MNYEAYQNSTDPNRFIDDCPCISCSNARDRVKDALLRADRAKIDRERGIYPPVPAIIERGFCDESVRHAHPQYTLCKNWYPEKTMGRCATADWVHERCLAVTWKPILDLSGKPAANPNWKQTLMEALPFIEATPLNKSVETATDMQKDLRTFRENMGNPILPLSGVAAVFGEPKPAPDQCGEYVAMDMAKVEEPVTYKWFMSAAARPPYLRFGWDKVIPNTARVHPMEPETPVEPKFTVEVKSPVKPAVGAYATLLTSAEIASTFGFIKETPEQREARRDREWAQYQNALDAMQTERENYNQKQRERSEELRIRQTERNRIADYLKECGNTKPTLTWLELEAKVRSL
jgi:hypothetical protein